MHCARLSSSLPPDNKEIIRACLVFAEKEAGEASFQICMGMENWYIHVLNKL